MNDNPIAVIDSGAGGLAALSTIRSIMPNEDIIYLADTYHMPFGSKTSEEICGYAKKMAAYLSGQNTKMIILACGTLSSLAINSLYEAAPMMLIQGIIEPAVASTLKVCTEENKVGLIATPGAVDSGSYQAAFSRVRKKLDVHYKGCPNLASLIESGNTDGPEMEALIKEYVGELVDTYNIDTLLLGCTHYPLASDCIKKLYPDLRLVDPALVLSKSAYSLMKYHEMDSERENEGSLRICVSKKTDSFVGMAERLGLGNIEIEEVLLGQ